MFAVQAKHRRPSPKSNKRGDDVSQYERDLIHYSDKAINEKNDERLYWVYISMLEIYRKNKNAQS